MGLVISVVKRAQELIVCMPFRDFVGVCARTRVWVCVCVGVCGGVCDVYVFIAVLWLLFCLFVCLLFWGIKFLVNTVLNVHRNHKVY